MKKYILLSSLLTVFLVACQEPETPSPNLNYSGTPLLASFQFINSASDAPDLDFYVNNIKIGATVPFGSGLPANAIQPITTSGVGANTNVRVKAASGNIGGLLGASDLIYRAGNTSTANMSAANGASYTFIAMDTISRPAPVRKLNALNFGDTTYVNLAAGNQLSVVERAALSSTDKAKTVAIGTVPLGQTDPGGIRFLLLTDTYVAQTANKAGIRLVNAVPNSNIWARLKPAAGSNITLGTNVGYALAFPTFSPSVGSRSLTSLAFTTQTIATSGTPIAFTLEVSTDNFTTIAASVPNLTFEQFKYYTVVVGGQKGKTDGRAIKASITLHK